MHGIGMTYVIRRLAKGHTPAEVERGFWIILGLIAALALLMGLLQPWLGTVPSSAVPPSPVASGANTVSLR
jgi:hypothetical protein